MRFFLDRRSNGSIPLRGVPFFRCMVPMVDEHGRLGDEMHIVNALGIVERREWWI